jgi:Ca2+:H+ antiporter
MPRWLYGLLFFSVLAIILNFFSTPPLLLFVCAGLGLVPLAALVGQSVERIAEHTGEAVGGLLFATFGNATELIIGIFALLEGLVDVVRAAIIGSILCNVLLMLGVATCIGSVKNGRLRFEQRPAGQYASLLALCVTGLLLPAIAEIFASRLGQQQIMQRGFTLSEVIAALLLIGYVLSILFTVFHVGDRNTEDEEDTFEPTLGVTSPEAINRLLALRRLVTAGRSPTKSAMLQQIDITLETLGTQTQTANQQHAHQESNSETDQEKKSPLLPSIALLALSTIGIAWLSEILVGTIEPFTTLLKWNPSFVGLVFLPLVSTLPEYLNTSRMALDKRMGMVLAATAGSSIQIALLVAPILVLISLLTPKRLDLVFSLVEIVVLGLGTFLYSEITQDGELVWLEGGLLILIYAMMGATVFLFGA